VQNLSSSSLLSKNAKIKICRCIILPVVVCGCDTWSLTLKEECRLRVFENMVLRRIFGSEGQVTGEWRRLHKESFMFCTPHQVHYSDQIKNDKYRVE
jgi:hypothetical protein